MTSSGNAISNRGVFALASPREDIMRAIILALACPGSRRLQRKQSNRSRLPTPCRSRRPDHAGSNRACRRGRACRHEPADDRAQAFDLDVDGRHHLAARFRRAPKSVANVLRYVREKHYDGTAIYRVVKGFVDQMGSFDAKGQGRGIDPAG